MKSTTASLLFIAGAQGQTLQSLLGTPGLTQLTAVLGKFPAITNTLANAKDITILAPADGARGIQQLLASTSGQGKAFVDRFTPGSVEAALTYRKSYLSTYTGDMSLQSPDVLKGAIPSSAIPANAFVETLLSSGNFSSVTGGQRIQVQKTASGVTFTSALGAKSKVTKADIKFNGGYIHLIDSVLAPPQSVATTARAGGLTTLARTLQDTDLLATVESSKDITIFAPTNGAFAKAAKTIDSLPESAVKGALTYHVVKGVGFSTGLKNGQQLPTVNGKPLTIKIEGGNVYVNNAKVIKTDLLTKNGVVHVIDSVLLPPA